MNIQQAYNTWAETYDTAPNKTRDLEAQAIRSLVPAGEYRQVLELGCGTGKNTEWLASLSEQIVAVDFSEEMLRQACQKLAVPHLTFKRADITLPWDFVAPATIDLLTCSLILEHIADLGHIFAQARRALCPGGLFYVGELHPFRQYLGSQARFETPEGSTQQVAAFVHHLSDFTETARLSGFSCLRLQEWFDDDKRTTRPRLATFLFQKQGE